MVKIGDYAYTNALRNVHPMEKVAFSFSFLLFTIATKNLYIACLSFLVMSIATTFFAKIPFSYYIKLLLLPSFFLFTSIITMVITIVPASEQSINAILSVDMGRWQIYISENGLKKAYQLAATALASVSCLYFLILTTTIHHFIWVLQKAKMPTLFIELVGLTYRFIFVLLDKVHEIYVAQSSRLGYQNYRVWMSSVAQLIVSLFIKSTNFARELQTAIDSRGGNDEWYQVELDLRYNLIHCTGIGFFTVVLLMISILT